MILNTTRTASTAGLAGRPRTWRRRLPALKGREGVAACGAILASALASLAYIWLGNPLNLAPDEAHYWEWSQHLDWSYYSKGPLVAWIIRGSCELLGELSVQFTGDLAAAVRTPAVLCHVAILAGWYVLAAGVFRSPRVGLMAVICGASLPVVRAAAVLMTIDPPFLACWSWALVCVWKALDRGGLGWWVGAAMLTALGVLAKFTMTLFPAAVVGFLLFHRRAEFRRPGIWILFAGVVMGWLPVIAWNAQHEWVSVRHVFGQVGGTGQATPSPWLGPVTFIGSQFGMMFALWLVVFLVAGWRFRPTREADPGVRLLWWCSIPVWCLFGAASFVKPGQPNWPAPAYVAGLVLAVAWVRDQLCGRYSRLVWWCLLLAVPVGLAMSFLVHYPALIRPALARIAGRPTQENPLPIRQVDMTARLAGWQTLAREVDRVRNHVKQRTGREPVLAATHWTVPGELRFYCQGHPTAYAVGIPNLSDRHSQYDLWRPNPLTDAQAFRGQTFVIVGDIASPMLAAFNRVESPIMVTHSEGGVPLAAWSVWVCHGFRGFAAVGGRRDPGY